MMPNLLVFLRFLTCSPGEEIAVVEHLKGMALTGVAAHELKTLLGALMLLGKEETARKLQRIVWSFQLSQMAAVKLADDCVSSETMDTNGLSLDSYIDKLKEFPDYLDPSWQSIILQSPPQVSHCDLYRIIISKLLPYSSSFFFPIVII